jgi:hypothetical protein
VLNILKTKMRRIIFTCVLLFGLWAVTVTATTMFGGCGPSKSSVPEKGFFPEDLTKVTWDHAVNSQALMDAALNSTVMMLEADILMGTKIGSNASILIPIMAHPPANTSDLTFEEFLAQVLFFNWNQTSLQTQKGIKLDVKQFAAVEPVLKILQANGGADFQFPVWLNADILRGPINSTGTPVDGPGFLNLTTTYLPAATLSVGWTTSYGTGNPIGKYAKDNVDEMINVLRSQNVSRLTPITYPVRAGIASQSLDEMIYLLDQSDTNWPNSTLTLWSSANDPVNMTLLHQLISTIGKNRCFTDLPFDL